METMEVESSWRFYQWRNFKMLLFFKETVKCLLYVEAQKNTLNTQARSLGFFIQIFINNIFFRPKIRDFLKFFKDFLKKKNQKFSGHESWTFYLHMFSVIIFLPRSQKFYGHFRNILK